MTLKHCAYLAGICALIAYMIGNTLLLRDLKQHTH